MATKPAQDFLIFLVGGALFAAGVFLFTNQVMVSSGLAGFGWSGRSGVAMAPMLGGLLPFGTGQGFGLLMVPFGLGVALLFTDSLRRLGWFLVWASAAALGAGVLQSLLRFQGEERARRRADMQEERAGLEELRRELEELRPKINRR